MNSLIIEEGGIQRGQSFANFPVTPTCSSLNASKIFIFKDIPICYNWNGQCRYNVSNFTPLSRVSWPICNSPITQTFSTTITRHEIEGKVIFSGEEVCSLPGIFLSLRKFGNYLPWTASAETPVFSIRLANSTVSWDNFNNRILQVTGVSKFLFKVVNICIWKAEFKKAGSLAANHKKWKITLKTLYEFAYIMNQFWFSQQGRTHPSTDRKRLGAAHIDIHCSNIFTTGRKSQHQKASIRL